MVFPQFADTGPLPKHGFARVQTWEVAEDSSGDSARAVLRLTDSEETRALWPHAFAAELTVELGERLLTVRLSIRNTDDRPISFTSALHTYLRVADVRHAAVEGLQGCRYQDKVAGGVLRVEEAARLTVAGEVDRVYLGTPSEVRLLDEAGRRMLRVRQEGFADTVVWNPWAEKAAALPDFGDEEYREMLCIEAAQVGEPIRLEPGEQWTGGQQVEIAQG